MGIHFIVIPLQGYYTIPSEDDYCINYSQKVIDGTVNIFACGLLHETGIRTIDPKVIRQDKYIMLFPAPPEFNLPFDLFSAIFYLISRFEEYTPFIPDQYGRFEAGQSHAHRNDYLREPVVDQWLLVLQETLLKKYAKLPFIKKRFQFESTIDIDNPWAYKHRGLLRNLAGMAVNAMQLNFDRIFQRIRVLIGARTDPFDVYSYIRQVEDRFGFQSVFFFLSGDYGHHDVNYTLNTKEFKELLRLTNNTRNTGVHPSYRSNSSYELLSAEMELFAGILGKRPEVSRQHFLMIRMPETYRWLVSLGITSDYSMGYASLPGFRAGTSLPFKFFDLQDEKEYPLLIHPFVVMDVTLNQYLHLGPFEASAEINALIHKIREVNGIFTPLWHNESLSEQGIWKGWRSVFEEMVEQVKGVGSKE